MTGRVRGKTAIVTGATSGIGRECALLLADEGARVVATGRNMEEGARTVRRIERAGGTAKFLRHEITDEDSWNEVLGFTLASFGRLDILVNCAGSFFVKPLEETSLAEFEGLWRVNVESVFLGTRAAMKQMRRQGAGGSIINISSLAGQVGLDQCSAYCSSKAAVTHLSMAAALEGAADGKAIRVNSVNPGVIWTEMITGSYGESEDIQQFFIEDTPLKMMGRPEHVAAGVLYLASDESRRVTGTALTIDGGKGAG